MIPRATPDSLRARCRRLEAQKAEAAVIEAAFLEELAKEEGGRSKGSKKKKKGKKKKVVEVQPEEDPEEEEEEPIPEEEDTDSEADESERSPVGSPQRTGGQFLATFADSILTPLTLPDSTLHTIVAQGSLHISGSAGGWSVVGEKPKRKSEQNSAAEGGSPRMSDEPVKIMPLVVSTCYLLLATFPRVSLVSCATPTTR